MFMNFLGKILMLGGRRAPAIAVVLTSLTLTGCISSPGPILTDANAILGEGGEIHFFSATGESGRTHSVITFQWNGSRYLVRNRAADISDFTVHPFEGRDLIVQSTAGRAPRPTEYALARRLAEGVYLLMPISEDDADDSTRDRFCTKTQDASCRIATPEQLFVLARATASKDEETGGIAVIVPGGRR